VQFTYDRKKSTSNKAKHGIDFVEAQALWLDDGLIEIPAKSDTELRFAVVGRIDKKHYAGFITYRDEEVRLISVRRARKEEVELYESRRTR
jgi:uncharacterized DUF497 family protein